MPEAIRREFVGITEQALEALRQNVRRNAFGRIQQLLIGALAVQQVADDKQSPLIAHDVERVGNNTSGARERSDGAHS